MLIHCSYCLARVNGVHHGHIVEHLSESERTRVQLLQCPACFRALIARDEFLQEGQFDEPDTWSPATRVWPEPDSDIPPTIPAIVRTSLVEANLCLRAGAFTASVVMTGRALEAMCHHFQTKKPMLALGLKELLGREIIDKRLFQWSEELRFNRNLAAHASGEQFSHDEAEDLFNFATAICDYVFVLNEKFSAFEMLGNPEPEGAGLSKPSVKQHLAGLRMLFDWLGCGAYTSQQWYQLFAESLKNNEAPAPPGEDLTHRVNTNVETAISLQRGVGARVLNYKLEWAIS